MPQNYPIDLKLGIQSCLNKTEALLKFYQNCITTSLIIHENMNFERSSISSNKQYRKFARLLQNTAEKFFP